MKAVYYCRVSTDEESQVNALESQIIEAKKCIELKGWTLVDGYVDEGKSGTQTQKRNEYNRLVNDMSSNKFDVVVIKSNDRLNRNTRDWYFFVDMLIENSKKLFFYLDNKFYTPDDALIIGIKAILAEEYSRDLSKKINNAHKNRQQSGKSIVITSATWGYDKINKQIVINEKEAEVVRLIYDLYIQGYGSRTISKELSNRGFKSRTGNDFAEITIRRIIRNPLFKGTVIMNKRHKDFETKKTIHTPKEDWIIHEDIVPAIISKEIWERANEIMNHKSEIVHSDNFGKRMQGKNLGKYNLSSKIFCGECNSVYWRRYRKNAKGTQIIDWSCSEYIKRGRKNIKDSRGKNKLIIETKDSGCDNIHINEEDLNNALIQLAENIFKSSNNNLINEFMLLIETELNNESTDRDLKEVYKEKDKILKQKDILMDKLLDGVISDEDFKVKNQTLDEKINTINQKENILKEREKKSNEIEIEYNKIQSILEKLSKKELNLKTLLEIIDKIKVYPTYLEVYLSFGEPKIINIDKKGNKTNYLYVDTTKYLIPHTDKYRHSNKLKPIKLSIYISNPLTMYIGKGEQQCQN